MTITNGNQARAAKAKGRDAENAVVDYLRLKGLPAERRRLTGCQDCGDIGGISRWVIEVKNEKRINLAGYLDELAAECVNADNRLGCAHGIHFGAAVLKRRGKGDPAQWYAVMPVDSLASIITQLARLHALEMRP